MDYFASMSIRCSLCNIISENSVDGAMEALGNNNIIRAFIKAAGAIIEKIINGVKAVVNTIRNGIKRIRNKSKAESPIMAQLNEFLNRGDELSAMLKKGASIINNAVDALNKVNITDDDINKSKAIMEDLQSIESDITSKLQKVERAKPNVSLFLVGSESEKLRTLLTNMEDLHNKLNVMKNTLATIQNKLDKSKDMIQFYKNSSAILRLRNDITSYGMVVMQFNTMLISVM